MGGIKDFNSWPVLVKSENSTCEDLEVVPGFMERRRLHSPVFSPVSGLLGCSQSSFAHRPGIFVALRFSALQKRTTASVQTRLWIYAPQT